MRDEIYREVERVMNPKLRTVNKKFEFLGFEILTQFLRSSTDSDTLVVRFHGAIQRDKRALPAFQANLKQMIGYCHQISICDPTMMTREGFSLGWYSGHADLDVQTIMREFLQQIKAVLGVRRVIYLGSSGGGFAALHYSFFDPGSVAVVMGPQTSIGAHIPAAVGKYIESCWPGLTYEQVAKKINADMCQLYAMGHENTVVYIQSTGDFLHNYRHMSPFIHAVHGNGERENTNFLLALDFWGRHGHAGAVPHSGYLRWLMSAVAAQSTSGPDILNAYFATDYPDDDSTGKATQSSKVDIATDQSSLRLADLLREYHLRQPMEK